MSNPFLLVMPEIFLACSAMILLIAGAFLKSDHKTSLLCIGVAVSIILYGILVFFQQDKEMFLFSGLLKLSAFSALFKVLIVMALLIGIGTIYEPGGNGKRAYPFEYPVLLLLSALGMMILLSTTHLLSVYMAIEMQSLALYILAAAQRNNARSSEAGTKYFILGALASGFILFGMSLIMGFSGVLDFSGLAAQYKFLPPQYQTGMLFGLIFFICGLAFKLSAAPFHMWTPDVYEGAPTHTTAFFAIVPKIVMIGFLAHFLVESGFVNIPNILQIIMALSLFSMIVGSFAGVVQKTIKRLLAYSTIGNVGYALIAMSLGSQTGMEAAFAYIILYALTTAGVFVMILSLKNDGAELTQFQDFAGLVKEHPFAAYALSILLFSLAGIPPLAGVLTKIMVFQEAMVAGAAWLAVIGVLTSVVAAFYYLRLIKIMMFDEHYLSVDFTPSLPQKIVLGLSLAVSLLLIIYPPILFDFVAQISQYLFL